MVYQHRGYQDEASSLMELVKELGSKADHPDTLLSNENPRAREPRLNDNPFDAAPTDSLHLPVTSYRNSGTAEQMRRTRDFLRRKENGLTLKPL